MKLYQRVRQASNEIAGSEVKMAESIGVHPRTFNGYMKPERESNLWPLLPRMLEEFPQLNREWLYFGEGEMLIGTNSGMKNEYTPNTPSQNFALERELDVLRELLATKDEVIHLQRRLLQQASPQMQGNQQDTVSGSSTITDAHIPAHGVRSSSPNNN